MWRSTTARSAAACGSTAASSTRSSTGRVRDSRSPGARHRLAAAPTHLQRGYEEQRGYQQGYRKPKRKEHWLTELFD